MAVPFRIGVMQLTMEPLDEMLASARVMAVACGPGVEVLANPGLRLGAAMGELALAGRDKVTFVTSPGIESFPDWIEQLVAESTGKHGKGIVPVVCEPLGPPSCYGADRFFVALILGEKDPAQEEKLAALPAAARDEIVTFVKAEVLTSYKNGLRDARQKRESAPPFKKRA